MSSNQRRGLYESWKPCNFLPDNALLDLDTLEGWDSHLGMEAKFSPFGR